MTKGPSHVSRFSGFGILSSFVIRLPRRRLREAGASSFFRCPSPAFTVLELLIVISIIIALAGLIIATTGYVQKKGARSRAEAEIAAMSAALESYKADNGIYPTDATSTEQLKATEPNPTNYQSASSYLYTQLSGDDDANPTTAAPANAKNYIGGALKPQMLSPNPPGANTFLRDPFGNSYGYSTLKASTPSSIDGYNPTFDLWSTAGGTSASDVPQWIKNW
jgi:type II secretory pathway pseudopilin PulG